MSEELNECDGCAGGLLVRSAEEPVVLVVANGGMEESCIHLDLTLREMFLNIDSNKTIGSHGPRQNMIGLTERTSALC